MAGLHLTTLTTPLRTHPLLAATVTTTLLTFLLPFLRAARASYRGWLALGPGGPPYNLVGWLAQAALRPLAVLPVRDPDIFTRPGAPLARSTLPPFSSASFLGGGPPLPARAGERPVVPGYIAPQRQTTQRGDAATRDAMEARVAAAVAGASPPGALELRPSGLEGRGTPAAWLRGDAASAAAGRRYLRGTRGEFAHVHPDASSHMVLSLADAEEAVRKGWAERHPLSGGCWFAPLGYVLVYAPRDPAELAVWERLLDASVAFMTAGEGGA